MRMKPFPIQHSRALLWAICSSSVFLVLIFSWLYSSHPFYSICVSMKLTPFFDALLRWDEWHRKSHDLVPITNAMYAPIAQYGSVLPVVSLCHSKCTLQMLTNTSVRTSPSKVSLRVFLCWSTAKDINISMCKIWC